MYIETIGSTDAMIRVDLPPDGKIEEITFLRYLAALEALRSRGFPFLVRIWNFICGINEIEKEGERYRAFCTGRKRAFDRYDLTPQLYPAASAVGIPQVPANQKRDCPENQGYFVILGSKLQPQMVSNPRQMEAYLYPEQYGPTPPSFARACIHKDRIFISGTAAIRGHFSTHPGDLEKQVDCTLGNLKSVCQQAHGEYLFADFFWHVYLRHINDFDRIKPILLDAGMKNDLITFQKADICRPELLVEIEGIYYGKDHDSIVGLSHRRSLQSQM